MKKVIFVCLLSLSVCLSVPTQQPETSQQAVNATTNTTATDSKPNAPKTELPVTDTETAAKSPANATATQNATVTNATQSTPSNETSSKTNDTKPAEKNNTTDTKTTTEAPVKTTEKVEAPKDKNATTPVPVANGTTAETGGKKNETTTPKGDNVSPTAAPVEAKTRAFDGPSFIGGIILTLGLLAIGFMGFKYYKNQTERNYHTL